MKSMWILMFSLLPLAGMSYVLWHVWQVLPWGNAWRWLVVAMGVMAFLSIFVGFMGGLDRLPLNLASVVYEVGDSTIFVMLYLVMAFLLLDLGRLFHLVPRQWLFANGPVSMAILALMLVVFGYGNAHYYQKARQPLVLSGHGKVKRPLKIVMMSDLHLGYHNRRAELHKWIGKVNDERPDLVLIAGDIIDISLRPLMEERMAEEFRLLKAPVIACLGNHEYIAGEPDARQFYQEAGITLLRDSFVVVGDVAVIGRDDRTNKARKPLSAMMRKVPEGKYTILLDHQPYHLEEAQKARVDFQFSGHTHHGQVWPISWVTEAIYEDAFGPCRKGDTHYYVSSGMGIWGGKFRIGTRSEYVVATLE